MQFPIPDIGKLTDRVLLAYNRPLSQTNLRRLLLANMIQREFFDAGIKTVSSSSAAFKLLVAISRVNLDKMNPNLAIVIREWLTLYGTEEFHGTAETPWVQQLTEKVKEFLEAKSSLYLPEPSKEKMEFGEKLSLEFGAENVFKSPEFCVVPEAGWVADFIVKEGGGESIGINGLDEGNAEESESPGQGASLEEVAGPERKTTVYILDYPSNFYCDLKGTVEEERNLRTQLNTRVFEKLGYRVERVRMF